ncbi:MAG: TIGR02449 family protein [Endozoicomonadaceae bacterium]|nr:TIGR02449 family protein [Endozoicomonadaceae bacterium]MCY4329381.1 TIGR02449 family protein [Endozoicomonadaceae bacterium]
MNKENNKNFACLESEIDKLITRCTQLHQENRILRTNEQMWKQERFSLTQKNELARAKIESMISKLKELEQ